MNAIIIKKVVLEELIIIFARMDILDHFVNNAIYMEN